MKNIIIWICGMLIGGLIGYGIGSINFANAYLWMGIGIILGSSIAITYNIHREDIDISEINVLEPGEVSEPQEDKEETAAPNHQKAS